MSSPSDYIALAKGTLGMTESDQGAAIESFLADGGVNLDPTTTAWCAGYVNSVLGQAGINGTDSLAARSFMNYGEQVDEPREGDIAVFSRGDPNGWQGHTGFFQGYDKDGNIRVLGGNQNDSVSIESYPADRLLSYRRPTLDNVTPSTPAMPGPLSPGFQMPVPVSANAPVAAAPTPQVMAPLAAAPAVQPEVQVEPEVPVTNAMDYYNPYDYLPTYGV